ncbi:MAG: hypothetical protein M1505_02820 [Patescibacteria group bacterium]|nr:hypothetical protein [Patescibacteria group bacterium]
MAGWCILNTPFVPMKTLVKKNLDFIVVYWTETIISTQPTDVLPRRLRLR